MRIARLGGLVAAALARKAEPEELAKPDELVALHGVAQEGVEAVRRAFPMQSDAETVTAPLT